MNKKKIKIKGHLISSFNNLQNEILDLLKIKISSNSPDDFIDKLNEYITRNKIELVEIIWSDFDISLKKILANLKSRPIQNFRFSNGSNLVFDANNPPYKQNKADIEADKMDEQILRQELNSFFGKIINVEIMYIN